MIRMKKTISALAFAAFLSISSCTTIRNASSMSEGATLSQKTMVEKILLEEKTRGTQRSITLTPKEKIVVVNSVVTKTKVSESEWKTAQDASQKLNLSDISGLQAPTSKRYSDGALIAILHITAAGKTYSSADFDSGNPPAELAELYQALVPNFRKK